MYFPPADDWEIYLGWLEADQLRESAEKLPPIEEQEPVEDDELPF